MHLLAYYATASWNSKYFCILQLLLGSLHGTTKYFPYICSAVLVTYCHSRCSFTPVQSVFLTLPIMKMPWVTPWIWWVTIYMLLCSYIYIYTQKHTYILWYMCISFYLYILFFPLSDENNPIQWQWPEVEGIIQMNQKHLKFSCLLLRHLQWHTPNLCVQVLQ